MKIDSFKDLKELFKLCRQEGVVALEVDGIKFNLDPAFKKPIKRQLNQVVIPEPAQVYVPGGITEDTQIITDGLTAEELLFYSSDSQSNEQQ